MAKGLYSDKREKFRKLLKQIRRDAGLTQVELAQKLNRPQSYVSEYERGHRRLDWVSVDEVMEACEESLAKFAVRYLDATGRS